jgi:dTMP kinase
MAQEQTHRRGLLVAFEGPDGVGKSTQCKLLKDWLLSRNEAVCVTKWSSSSQYELAIEARKAAKSLTPESYAMLHAVDFRARYLREMLPALANGQTVLADSYVFTGVANDVARGLDRTWSLQLYQPVRWPDVVFYFSASVDTCVQRITATRQPTYYEAGQDITHIADPVESYRLFTQRVIAEYASLSQQFLFMMVDAEKDRETQQEFVRNIYEASQRLVSPTTGSESKVALSAAY